MNAGSNSSSTAASRRTPGVQGRKRGRYAAGGASTAEDAVRNQPDARFQQVLRISAWRMPIERTGIGVVVAGDCYVRSDSFTAHGRTRRVEVPRGVWSTRGCKRKTRLFYVFIPAYASIGCSRAFLLSSGRWHMLAPCPSVAYTWVCCHQIMSLNVGTSVERG